jgi:phytoene synthase
LSLAQRDSAALVADSHAVLQRHGRSFALAGALLSREQADEAAVVYAFCRLVDDLADEAPDAQTAAANLGEVDAELRGQRPPRPLVEAWMRVMERRAVPIEAGRELMNGVLSDLGEVRVADDRALLRYCYRVAGTVGLMMCGVIGVTEAAALPHAVDLGLGMQLTNICRDVAEDAGRGRCYLPETRLAAVGLSHDDLIERHAGGHRVPPALIADAQARARLASVVDDLLELAEGCYDRAWLGMSSIPARPRSAIIVAAVLYREIGRQLRRARGSDPLFGRTMLRPHQRALAFGQGLALALAPRSWRRDPALGLRPPLHAHLRGLGGLPPV